jgi:hypothetical protein
VRIGSRRWPTANVARDSHDGETKPVLPQNRDASNTNRLRLRLYRLIIRNFHDNVILRYRIPPDRRKLLGHRDNLH